MTYLFVLMIKHYIVDLGLQAYLLKQDKRLYFGNGHIHYLQHSVATIIVSIFFLPAPIALLVGLLDYIIHWHIDFGKHCFTTHFNIEARSMVWWWCATVDQILHLTTYLVFAIYFL